MSRASIIVFSDYLNSKKDVCWGINPLYSNKLRCRLDTKCKHSNKDIVLNLGTCKDSSGVPYKIRNITTHWITSPTNENLLNLKILLVRTSFIILIKSSDHECGIGKTVRLMKQEKHETVVSGNPKKDKKQSDFPAKNQQIQDDGDGRRYKFHIKMSTARCINKRIKHLHRCIEI